MKKVIFAVSLIISIFSASAQAAAGGNFSCQSTSLVEADNIFVQGIVDGEANVLEAYSMVVGGDDDRTYLTTKEISLVVNYFKIVLQDSTPEEPKTITVTATNINGVSAANFEVRNGEVVTTVATGECKVYFTPGI